MSQNPDMPVVSPDDPAVQDPRTLSEVTSPDEPTDPTRTEDGTETGDPS